MRVEVDQRVRAEVELAEGPGRVHRVPPRAHQQPLARPARRRPSRRSWPACRSPRRHTSRRCAAPARRSRRCGAGSGPAPTSRPGCGAATPRASRARRNRPPRSMVSSGRCRYTAIQSTSSRELRHPGVGEPVPVDMHRGGQPGRVFHERVAGRHHARPSRAARAAAQARSATGSGRRSCPHRSRRRRCTSPAPRPTR